MIKSFSQYADSLNEAVNLANLNSRVFVDDSGRNFEAEFELKYAPIADKIVGAISFGTSTFPRTMIIDNNYAYDQQLARSKYVARIQNSLTTYENGYVQNATLAKFDLEKGTMWLAEDDNDDGSIRWGRGFKFKRMFLHEKNANKFGWLDNRM